MQNIILDVSQSWAHPGHFAEGEEIAKSQLAVLGLRPRLQGSDAWFVVPLCALCCYYSGGRYFAF